MAAGARAHAALVLGILARKNFSNSPLFSCGGPPSASLLAPVEKQSYEHPQGRKLLYDIEHVLDFVEMKRFDG